MAYDRYDTRQDPRGERSRWRDERPEGRDRGHPGREDRGFFERAGDEIASWFGDDEAERRRHDDQRMEGHGRGWSGDRERDEERGRFSGRDRDPDRSRFNRDDERGFFGDRGYRGTGGEGGGYRGYGRDGWRSRSRQADLTDSPGLEAGSKPLFGGYTAAESQDRYWRGEPGRRGDFSSHRDPHYHSWRQRQLDELDRDYDDYRRENQARFESDFGSWRERRMQKRGLLGQVREHMEVVGNDDAHVGTVDRIAGDRIILTRSDPESGGAHHSLSCSDIARVEGDRVMLDCSAEQAKQRWRDESRNRALFEREDQGEMGDRVLDRSFSGTYR